MSNETWLFGAEVNRIQDTLFAAGLQRQVVGGSRLLAVFTEGAAKKATLEKYGAKDEDVVVKAGGTFRIVFPNEAKAKSFGEYIAHTYHLLLDGVMTIPEPVMFVDRGEGNCDPEQPACKDAGRSLCFVCANEKLEWEMGKLKRTRPFAITPPQTPSNAICQSSGTQSAEEREPLEGDNEEYMSGPAFRMKEVGHVEKKSEPSAYRDAEREGFLYQIRKAISDEQYHNRGWARLPEELAQWDTTQNNIAYLVADGNNIGKYFRQCRTPDQRKALSKALLNIVYEAIAEPIPALAGKLFYREEDKEKRLPLLPLIAAGDDIFIMLPAPYALDYARRFCLAFSEKMNNVAPKDTGLPDITMSAAVIFCKQSYPYLLAHKAGEQRLKQTKQVVKTAGPQLDRWQSAVSFDFIIGSAGSNGRSYSGEYRPTLPIYWADDNVTNEAALPLKRLFDQRLALDNRHDPLPAKRRAELRTLFDQPPNESNESYQAWNSRLHKLLQRIEETGSKEMRKRVEASLKQLGTQITSGNPAGWREVTCLPKPHYAHGLPDLIAIWNYAQSLDTDFGHYE